MILRDDQNDALLAILEAWSNGLQRPAVVAPTGWGKTILFAKLCSFLARKGHRPLILCNRDELVRQTVDKLRSIDPHLSVGVIQAGRHELHGNLAVASVQTLSRQKRLSMQDMNRFDRIVCDEAHFAAADSWRRVLEYFGAFDKSSSTKIVGVTATMVRTDKRGLGEIWEDIIWKRSTRWAIERGFLVPVRAQTVVIPDLDLAKVKVRNGDLSDGDLGKAMSQAKAGPLVAQAYLDLARSGDGELRRGICFAPTIEVAESFLIDFRRAGIPTELVIGTTPTVERQEKYSATRAGTNRVLMSVGVLTTGFDEPSVSCAVIARPTKSKGLYQQMVGRALRLSPETGKTEALILDVVGASRLGLAELVDLQLDQPIKEGEDDLELDELGAPIITPVLPPEAPDEVAFREVNPFDGMDIGEIRARKTLMRRPAASRHWRMTYLGIPFLPPSETFPHYVALHQDEIGTWSAWRAPVRSGQSVRVCDSTTFPEAVLAALEARGPITELQGSASDAQMALLNRMRVAFEPDGLTKADAGHLLNIHFASKRLDK